MAREGAGKSLCEDPEKPFHEAVKMYSDLCWRCQDVGKAKVLACLPRRATYRKENQPKREKCALVIKAGGTETSKPFNIGQSYRFGVFPAEFFSLTQV